MLATPSFAIPTKEDNAQNALRINAAADLPVMLCKYPYWRGARMGETFPDMAIQSSNICAIKGNSWDISRAHLLACVYPHIQMSWGMDDQTLKSFAWPAGAWVCAGSIFRPQAHVALDHATAVQRGFAKGRKIMAAMMRVLEQSRKFIACVKQGVSLGGLNAGGMTPRLSSLNGAEVQELAGVITRRKSQVAAAQNGS